MNPFHLILSLSRIKENMQDFFIPVHYCNTLSKGSMYGEDRTDK